MSVITHYAQGAIRGDNSWMGNMNIHPVWGDAEQGPCFCMTDERYCVWIHDLYEHDAPHSCSGPYGEMCGGCVNCVSMQVSYYQEKARHGSS